MSLPMEYNRFNGSAVTGAEPRARLKKLLAPTRSGSIQTWMWLLRLTLMAYRLRR